VDGIQMFHPQCKNDVDQGDQMIVAKPVIDQQFWILQRDEEKIGNVEACAGGYQVKINNQITQYKTIRMVEQRTGVRFEPPMIRSRPRSTANSVHGYPTVGRVHNPVWDVPHALPLYTKGAKSRSWFAAGWYSVKKGRKWKTVQDPKLIVLQRYPYHGPFYNQQEITND
jgi:hypothetical protein